MPNRPVVGPKAFSSFVQQMRMAYPDLAYEVGQVSHLTRCLAHLSAAACTIKTFCCSAVKNILQLLWCACPELAVSYSALCCACRLALAAVP